MDAELQDEEVEVLQSIYPEDVTLSDSFEHTNDGAKSLLIKIPGPHQIQLLVHLPLEYPSKEPPIAEVYESFGLNNAQRDAIVEDLHTIFERSQHQVCLYEWIEKVREQYETEQSDQGNSNTNDTAANEEEDREQPPPPGNNEAMASYVHSRPRVQAALQLQIRDLAREELLTPLIFHGETLLDRKSTFQAHVCPVKSVEDVWAFLSILLQDRKIARATHNMLAYRIVGDFVIKDNDEDGEDGAGSKLSHLMELTNATNVAVLVSRWYGGIKLGPDRFKHINHVARKAMEQAGSIPSSSSK